MPAIRRNGPGYLALCMITLAVVAASGMVAAQSLALQGPDQGKAGETVKVDIVLDRAPGGISGYRISLSLKDSGLGEFREVEYPPWAEITENSPLPSPGIWIKAVDTKQGVEMNATHIIIATLSIYCFKDGPLAMDYGAVRIDDDEGNSLQGSAGLVIPTGDETVTPAPTPTSTTAAQGTFGTGGGSGGGVAGGSGSPVGTLPTVHPSLTRESLTAIATPTSHHWSPEATPASGSAAGITGDAPESTPAPAATRASLGWILAFLGVAGAVVILTGRE